VYTSSSPEITARVRDSVIWLTESRPAVFGSNSDFEMINPVPLPGAVATQQWTHSFVTYYNLDQLANEMPHLQPVATPHNITMSLPFQGRVAQNLIEVKKKHRFISNWFVSVSDARKMGLLVKKGHSFHRIQRTFLTKLFHISQHSNAEELLAVPFSMSGSAILFPQVLQEVAFRERLGTLGPHLFISKKIITSGEHVMRLKPNARDIIVPIARPSHATASLFPQGESEVGGGRGSAPQPHYQFSQVRITHYYNIADVRLPETFSLSDEVTTFETQNPCVPVDGISGKQLMVDALVNLPNVDRCVWFTAAQLLTVGARCGVNAVPVLVSEVNVNPPESVWCHVSDLEDPQGALALVGKI
jgi:hypothetical protein